VGRQRGDGTLLERSRMWFSVKIGGGGGEVVENIHFDDFVCVDN
jgi:hypothetical protein